MTSEEPAQPSPQESSIPPKEGEEPTQLSPQQPLVPPIEGEKPGQPSPQESSIPPKKGEEPAEPSTEPPVVGSIEVEEMNSDYSTNFTGYSECSRSLSDFDPDEPPPDPTRVLTQRISQTATSTDAEKIPTSSNLRGSVVGLQLAPDETPEEIVVSIEVDRGKKAKRSIEPFELRPGENPNVSFDFETVRKGWSIKFLVTRPENEVFSIESKKVRDIEFDNTTPIQVPLKKGDATVGHLLIIFERTLILPKAESK
jgi:hypothetical protein